MTDLWSFRDDVGADRADLTGMTVEGVDSTRDVQRLAQENQVEIPFHAAIHRVLFEGAHPREILEVLR